MRKYHSILVVAAALTLSPVTVMTHAQNAIGADASVQVSPKYHRMPCPAEVQPSLAQVTWVISNDKTHTSHSGHKVVGRIRRLSRVYHAICQLTLVNPLVIACFGNPSGQIARYKVAFFRRSNQAARTLLRVTERRNGCLTLTVDNRRDLGAVGPSNPGLVIP